jgi:hypothetical protein
MKKLLLTTTAVLFLDCQAFSQSSPGLSYGQIPTAGQWNSYFAAKQDYLGFTPFNPSGGTITGNLSVEGQLQASISSTPTAICGGTGVNAVLVGTNQSGVITAGGTASAICTITFSPALTATPSACVISPANSTAAAAASGSGAYVALASLSTSSFVISGVGAVLQNRAYSYLCF